MRPKAVLPDPGSSTVVEGPQTAAPPAGVLRNRDARDDLVLVVRRVLAGVVVCRDRRCIEVASVGIDPEVVADESRAAADAGWMRRVELRIPGMSRHAEVVADGLQVRRVKLDRRIDAVVRSVEWLARVPGQAGPCWVVAPRRRAAEPAVVEGDRDLAAGRVDREVRLQLVDRTCVVVDEDRPSPRLTLVVRGGQPNVRDAE